MLRLGAVYLPLNTAYTEAELEYFLTDAEPSLLVGTPERAAALQGLLTRLAAARGAGAAASPSPPAPRAGPRSAPMVAAAPWPRPRTRSPQASRDATCRDDDLAAILYTSNLIANARTLAALWRFTPADRLLHALPLFHIHGLFVAINVTLAAGASVHMLPRFEPALVLRELAQATVLMGVPTHYVRLLADAALTREAAAHMRLFVCGSAPLLPETHQAWRERTGHTILERYGMSETGMNCSNPYEGERRAGSVGPPLPDVQLRIVDPDTAQPQPYGEIGMIEVRGPNVFAGYWRAAERTQESMRGDGYFITGDLGLCDAQGYVSIVGRARDLIISGGYNVYPREVELEIDALPGVRESAVIGLAHPDYGEGVTALVVRDAAAAGTGASLHEAAVLAALRHRLAGYKLPKRVLFIDELPRNVMGKVQKVQLRAVYAQLYTAQNR